MKPRKGVIYLRVSTEEQHRSGLGLEAQERACVEWCARTHVEVVEVVRDTASGGLPLERRTGLLEAVAKTPRGGVLVASRVDRIARDVEVSALVGAALKRRRAELVTLDVQASDPLTKRVMQTFLELTGEIERSFIRARTKAALAARRARGQKTGGRVPYGWKVGEGGLLEPEPDEWPWVEVMRRLRREGLSYKLIAEHLNRSAAPPRGLRWHTTTVVRILARQS